MPTEDVKEKVNKQLLKAFKKADAIESVSLLSYRETLKFGFLYRFINLEEHIKSRLDLINLGENEKLLETLYEIFSKKFDIGTGKRRIASFNRGICIVPLRNTNGHNYLLEKPIVRPTAGGDRNMFIMEDGYLGNHMSDDPEDMRLATYEETERFFETLLKESLIDFVSVLTGLVQ